MALKTGRFNSAPVSIADETLQKRGVTPKTQIKAETRCGVFGWTYRRGGMRSGMGSGGGATGPGAGAGSGRGASAR